MVLQRKIVAAPQHPEMGGFECQIVDRADHVIVRSLGCSNSWDVLEHIAKQVCELERLNGVKIG